MQTNDYLTIFRETGALLEGHFVLTSGRHSSTYFQCAKVLQYPRYLTLFTNQITKHFQSTKIDVVISPAVGGIVIGTFVGNLLGVRTIFAEREKGKMTLRRGFVLNPDERVLVVEDVITTGGSVREVIKVVNNFQAKVVGVGVIVDRSDGTVKLHENQFALVPMKVVSYGADAIPKELANIAVIKPGSRDL